MFAKNKILFLSFAWYFLGNGLWKPSLQNEVEKAKVGKINFI